MSANQGFGLVFGFDQDVAGAVFLAAVAGGHFVVFSLDFCVGDGVGFLKIDKQFANQQRLAGHFQVLLVFGGAIQATAGGFLHEDFAGDHFFFELRLHLGGQFAATALFNLLF